MGRGKLALEFITKDRSRKTTFEKRKKGLMKKAEEFSILCGVDTCMIIYNEDDSSGREPMIWPQDPERVKQVINRYLSEGVERRNRRAMSLPDFFIVRKRKVENELARVRSANLAAKYHVSNELLDGFSHDQLQALISMLGMKLEAMKDRLLAAKESALMNTSGMVPMHMDDFKFSSSVHPNVNDYLPMELKPPFEFQPPVSGPYFPSLMDSNLMMNGLGPMILPQNGDSSSSTTTSNGILGNHQNNTGYHYNYSITVPAYNRSFYQSPPFLTHHSGTGPMYPYNHMRESLPVPENTMFDSSGQGILGNASSFKMMMMMMPPPKQQTLILPDLMTQQGNTNSSSEQAVQFHDNGNSYNQFFPPNGGNN